MSDVVNYLRIFAISIGAVLMGVVALVVGPSQIDQSWSRAALAGLVSSALVLTVRYMPVRLPGESSARDDTGDSRPGQRMSTVVIALAAVAGGAAAPLLTGNGYFYFFLAVFAGWLGGLAVKLVLKMHQRRAPV